MVDGSPEVLAQHESATGDIDALLHAVAAAPPVPLPEDTDARLPVDTVVDGTFRVEAVLGTGAMGVVYLATDLALDRRVALKLHASASDDANDSRMWREAKAMARLTHPNVITVYEVGAYLGRVYIAMELVDGGTVRDWLAQPRPWGEVLDVFTQAAQGLAAAHEVGLVHRDFKPTNMLLGRDGRVRVADFGLARSARDVDDTTYPIRASSSDRSPSLDARVTATGTEVGTPAYMAPEQWAGHGADHRSDQYAFFVSLHEALYGERPAGGIAAPPDRGAVERDTASSHGRGRIPPWLRALVQRGASADPDARFADMRAVVAALQADPTRWRRALFGGLAVIGAGLAAWGAWTIDRHHERTKCEAEADTIASTWNDDAATALHDALVATGASFAEPSFARVRPFIDAQVQAWREQYASSCIATAIEGTRTEAQWLASAQCLEHRRGELAALLEVLSDRPDQAMVQDAVAAVAGLGAVDRCADDAWLARHPAIVDPESDEHRAGLWRAAALYAAGRYDEGSTIAEQLVHEIDPDDVGLRVPALILSGELYGALGRPDDAVQRLTEGFELALGVTDDDAALAAATELVHVVGSGQRRHEEGLWWGHVARGLLIRLGDDDRLGAAALHNNVGMVYEAQGRPDEAEREHRSALTIRERLLGPRHPHVAYAHNNLGTVHLAQERLEEAEEELSWAAAILTEVLGPEHPDVGLAQNNLGSLYTRAGRYAEAVRAHALGLAILQESLGADHPQVATSHSNLGNAYSLQGRHAEAERELLRALSIREDAFGPRHPGVAAAHNHLGNLYGDQGRHAEAEREHTLALEIVTVAHGPEHPRTAASHDNLGRVYQELGRYDEAQREHEQALTVHEKVFGPEHPNVAASLANLGAVHRLIGRYDESEPLLERARAIREAALGPDHPSVGHTYVELGRLHAERGRPVQAKEAYARALAIYEKSLEPSHPATEKARAELNGVSGTGTE